MQEIEGYICKFCNKFVEGNKKVYANHIRWCKQNPKYKEILKSTKEKTTKTCKRKHTLKEFNVKCENCGKEFIVIEDEKKFPSKQKYFCCRSCSNVRKHSKETKEKISQSVQKFVKKYKKSKFCPECGKEHNLRRIYCSKECYSLHRIKQSKQPGMTKYYEECSFNFGIKTYPDEFNFSLIEKYGWYSASNRGNNLNGISRDHKYSRMEGWLNKIDPYIISHPANCELLQHSKNIGKNKKCSISLEDLIENIKKWNLKYGKFPNKINYNIFRKLGIEFSILYS